MKIKNKLFDEASGSIGGFTFAGSQGGMYMKTKSNPRNPNTAKQQIVRSAMAGATVKWRSMTTAQRKVWDSWGKTLDKEDILGNKVEISGWSAFAGAWILTKRGDLYNETIGANTSISSGYFSIGTINAVQGASKLQIASGVPQNTAVLIFVSPVLSQTINNFGGTYDYSRNGIVKNTARLDVQAKVPAGKRVFVKIVGLESGGRYSEPKYFKVDG
jgi:hypothetical protein